MQKNLKIMQITKNFDTHELGVKYDTSALKTVHICQLVYEVLQPLRNLLNEPIIINSGLRTKEENEDAGGVPNSQHLFGQAADFTCNNIKKAFNLLKSGYIEFDQLIYYRKRKFIHISYRNELNRNEIIIK